MTTLVICVSGLLILSVLLSARAFEARHWRQSLVGYGVTFPKSVNSDQLTAWFTSLAALTHRPSWSLLPLPPVVIETVADKRGIRHHLYIARQNQAAVLSSLRAGLPGVRFHELPAGARPHVQLALELTMTSRSRPLAIDRAESTSAALLSSLQPLPGGVSVVLQTILTSAGTPRPVKQASASPQTPLPWLVEGEAPIDAEAVGQLRKKYDTPLLSASIRVGVSGAATPQALRLIGRSWRSLQALNAPGVRLVRRYLPASLIGRRLTGRKLPLTRWALLVNCRELVGLTGLPTGATYLPGLRLGAARQLPAPTELPRRGLVLGASNYPGQSERPLALAPSERLRHQYVVGPTGSGKSWLLANCVLQDIEQGRGVFLVDVKGDLVADVLARIRPKDEPRLIVLDPGNRARPVGYNLLAHAGTEATRELVVDHVLHAFRELWRGSWGPRSDYVLRGALRTCTLARGPGGDHLTLVELVPLLTQPAFRRSLRSRTQMPPDLLAFWDRYEAMSDGEMAQVIGPTINKLDAFTSRTAIRLMLGQSSGVDLTEIFTGRAAVLVSLDKGQLGAETANLLGSLLVTGLWNAALTRSRIAPERRRPCFAYIDEFQDIARLPLSIDDMLAQARGYGLGLTLANQYVAQLPDSIRAAILGTVRSQLSFAIDYDDARLLERRFEPLTRDDLMGLGRYEFALRPCVDGQTQTPVTGITQPLPPALADPGQVGARAAARRGLPRTAVEEAMRQRLEGAAPSAGFGRTPRNGGDR